MQTNPIITSTSISHHTGYPDISTTKNNKCRDADQ